MKVTCTRITNIYGQEVDESPVISVGREYLVVSIFYGKLLAKSEYRIVGDDGQSALFPIENFEISDARLSPNWICFSGEEYMELAPEAWVREGFWEDYYDDVPTAVEDYERELTIMRHHASQLYGLT
jgi:hypothetical protein